MRWRLAALVALAGCQDPSVAVTVEVPDGATVATIVVRVLTPPDPPDPDSFDCDDLAFGLVDPGQIVGATATVVRFAPDEGAPIDDVPRTGTKLWLAEGLAGDGTSLFGGCVSQATIEGDAEVVIPTEQVVDLRFEEALREMWDPLPASVTVRIDDGALAPVADRPVTLEVFSADGVGDPDGLPAPRTTDPDGRVTFALEEPDVYGPIVVHARARWARDQPAVLHAFRDAAPGQVLQLADACSDGATVGPERWIGFSRAAHRVIAGLVDDDGESRLYIAGWNGVTAPTHGCTLRINPNVEAFAVFRQAQNGPARLVTVSGPELLLVNVDGVDADGDGLDEQIRFEGLADTDWVHPDPGPSPAPAVGVVSRRNCGGFNRDDRVLVQLHDDDFHRTELIDRDGDRPADQSFAAYLDTFDHELRLVQGGCIAQGTGETPLPAVVLERPGATPDRPVERWLAIDDVGRDYRVQLSPDGPIDFTRIDDDEDLADPLLVGARLGPGGAEVVRWRVLIADGTAAVRDVGGDQAMGMPRRIWHDHLDGDALLDTTWAALDDAGDLHLQLSLGKRARGEPLLGTSPAVGTGPGVVVLRQQSGPTADLIVAQETQVIFIDTDAL